jgi:hypothetical protein
MAVLLVDPPVRLARPAWPFRLNTESPQARGLALWYPHVVGRAFRDESGNGRHSTPSATGLTLDDVVGTPIGGLGIRFQNSTDEVILPNISTAIPLPLSIAMWVMSSTAGADQDVQTVLSSGNGGAGNYGIYLSVGGSRLSVFTGLGGGIGSSVWINGTANTITVGRWHLVGVSLTSASQALYVDGQASGTDNDLQDGFLATTLLGRRDDDLSGFSGVIAETRIYNRVLTAAEWWALYDPRTRWDLYRPPTSAAWFDVTIGGGGGNRRRRFFVGASA